MFLLFLDLIGNDQLPILHLDHDLVAQLRRADLADHVPGVKIGDLVVKIMYLAIELEGQEVGKEGLADQVMIDIDQDHVRKDDQKAETEEGGQGKEGILFVSYCDTFLKTF